MSHCFILLDCVWQEGGEEEGEGGLYMAGGGGGRGGRPVYGIMLNISNKKAEPCPQQNINKPLYSPAKT